MTAYGVRRVMMSAGTYMLIGSFLGLAVPLLEGWPVHLARILVGFLAYWAAIKVWDWSKVE